MNSTERAAVLDAAQRLFGLTNAELARILVDPEQLLAIADVLAAAESSISRSSSPSSPCGNWSSTATTSRFSEDRVFDEMIRTGRALTEEDSPPLEEAASSYGVLLIRLIGAAPRLGTASVCCVLYIPVATTRIPCPVPVAGTVGALLLV